MGISGLLPFLKKASRPANVEEFSGKTVAIDVYCWLHKGAFGCADKLVQNQPTNGYIVYVMRYLDMLLHYNVKPILVFDGRNLPSKSETEKKRRENREKYRKMAKDYLREGKVREAKECFQRCVDITPAMAREVIGACRERNIDCIVAPYEADSQLAYLSISGIADFVISEDSDLAPFGCSKILFKMDHAGNGILIEKDKLHLCMGGRADNFKFDKFRYMCIMAGCDYLPSLPGIGIGKSCKFWGKVTNNDLSVVLPKIPSYLNMGQLEVTEDYLKGFVKAVETFLHQLVYDPKERRLRPLMDYPEDSPKPIEHYTFAGTYENEDLAYQMAVGNVDIHSMDVVSAYDPELDWNVDETSKPRFGKRSTHPSMWWRQDRLAIHLSGDHRDLKQKNKEKNDQFQKSFDLPQCAPAPIGATDKKRKAIRAVSIEEDPEVQEQEMEVIEMYSKPAKRSRINSGNAIPSDVIENSREQSKEITPIKKEVVFVSKYFAKPTLVEEKTIEVKSPIKKTVKRQSGDWLTELENSDDEQMSKNDDSKENFHLTKLSTLPPLKNNPSTRFAFKPVIASNKPSLNCSEETKKEDLAKKRNPFAKKRDTEVSPVKKDLEVSPVQKDPEDSLSTPEVRDSFQLLDVHDSGCFSQTPVEVSSSQLSICNLDGSLPSTQIKTSPCGANRSKEISPKSEPTESPYFAKKSTQQSQSTPKNRVPVSGLLKKGQPKKIDAKQPNLLAFWSKKQ